MNCFPVQEKEPCLNAPFPRTKLMQPVKKQFDFVSESAKKTITFYKKCLTSPYGSGIVNKLSQGIASGILKKKSVFRKFKLTVDNRLNLW